MEKKYKVIYIGEKTKEFNEATFIERFTTKYGTPEKAQKLLQISIPTLLKKDLSEEKATEYQIDMQRMGLVIYIEENEAELNIYQAPSAALISQGEATVIYSVPAGNGIKWLKKALKRVLKSPFIWFFILLFYSLLLSGVSSIPYIGDLISTPFSIVLMGGIMLGCQAYSDGKKMEIRHLFAGFDHSFQQLLLLGFIYLISLIAIVLLVFALSLFVLPIDIPTLLAEPNLFMELYSEAFLMAKLQSIALALVFISLAFLPYAGVWFAPALITIDGQDAKTAFLESFKACLKNILPMMILGLAFFMLLILIFIPAVGAFYVFKVDVNQLTNSIGVLIALGLYTIITLFLYSAVYTASSYASYYDIFHHTESIS